MSENAEDESEKRNDKKEADEIGDEILFKQPESRDDSDCPLSAIYERGWDFYTDGVYNTAFEYWTKAAAIGDVAARYQLSVMYERALGVEEDEKKQLEHLKAAAVAWNTYARYYLGCIEWRQNEKERAIKHWIIGSKLGHDKSLKEVKDCYEHDEVSKEDFGTTLRAHQAAVDATKSPQREEAEARQNSS